MNNLIISRSKQRTSIISFIWLHMNNNAKYFANRILWLFRAQCMRAHGFLFFFVLFFNRWSFFRFDKWSEVLALSLSSSAQLSRFRLTFCIYKKENTPISIEITWIWVSWFSFWNFISCLAMPTTYSICVEPMLKRAMAVLTESTKGIAISFVEKYFQSRSFSLCSFFLAMVL